MDLGDHLRPRFSIFCQAAVVLKVEDRLFGLRAEDPVDLSHIEAERAERGLDLGDVLPAHHGPTEEEHSIAQAVTRLVEGAPGVRAHYPVDVEAPCLLKAPHRLTGPVGEHRAAI